MKKPQKNILYIFQFPRYVSTWRLKCETEKGYFFYTSKGGTTSIVSPARFDFMYRNFLIDKVEIPCESENAPSRRIKIVFENDEPDFMARKYTKEMLISMIDDIDDIEF